MDSFKQAGLVADAACFLDGMREFLPPQYRNEAEQHVEHLHDTAKLLAGERVAEIYNMDDLPELEAA